MLQKYDSDNSSSIARNESFKNFVESGRRLTIKKNIIHLLCSSDGLTAWDLSRSIGCVRTSVCHPLKELLDNGWIEVIGTRPDPKTKSIGSVYKLSSFLISPCNELRAA